MPKAARLYSFTLIMCGGVFFHVALLAPDGARSVLVLVTGLLVSGSLGALLNMALDDQ